jgi:hypothetical protein
LKNHDGTEIDFSKGYAEVKLNSLREFQELIQLNNNFKGYLFRGLSRSRYTLVPSFYRPFHDFSPNLWSVHKEHLDRFKLSIRGRLDINEIAAENENEIWAVGQHYGLATPLLDWTASPFVALFFAFQESRSIHVDGAEDLSPSDLKSQLDKEGDLINEDRAVYFLNAIKSIEMFHQIAAKNLKKVYTKEFEILRNLYWMKAFDKPENEPLLGEYIEQIGKRALPVRDESVVHACNMAIYDAEFSFFKIFSPASGKNPRLVNQRGIFTKQLQQKPIDDFIQDRFNKEAMLLKVLLPNQLRLPILNSLDSMNINFLSLFPDLIGSSQFCNTKAFTEENLGPIDRRFAKAP